MVTWNWYDFIAKPTTKDGATIMHYFVISSDSDCQSEGGITRAHREGIQCSSFANRILQYVSFKNFQNYQFRFEYEMVMKDTFTRNKFFHEIPIW